jgi:hypothetical protein
VQQAQLPETESTQPSQLHAPLLPRQANKSGSETTRSQADKTKQTTAAAVSAKIPLSESGARRKFCLPQRHRSQEHPSHYNKKQQRLQ